MSANLYCIPCRQMVPEGRAECIYCRGTELACLQCHQRVEAGNACRRCAVEVVVSREVTDAQVAVAGIPAAVSLVPKVQESYQAGKFGVSAEVSIPPRDAAIMNELLQLVQLLHGMAVRLNQFAGLTDHTRQVIRNMRSLANEVQEEVELRRGPL